MKNAEPRRPPQPSKAAPGRVRAGWREAVLVCKDCERRSRGPKRLSAAALAKMLKQACRTARVGRPRLLLTNCMGVCPKKAYTVAALVPGSEIAVIAFHRKDDADAAVAMLFPRD